MTMGLVRRLGAVLALGLVSGCVGVAGPVPTVQNGAQPYGYVCNAGFYTCNLSASLPVGTACSCPGIGAPSYGRVR